MFCRLLFTILFFSSPLLYSNTAFSEVYKWVDDDGEVFYGDKPDTDNAEKIKIKNTPEKDQQYQERLKKQQKLLNVIQEERDEKISLKKEENENKELQKLKCTEIVKELQEIKDANFLYEKTDITNNPRFLSDEEREYRVEKYEKYIQKYC